MKENGLVKTLKNHIIVIWIVITSFLLSAIIYVSATYTEPNHKIKRVLAPAAISNNLFTSNYLSNGTTTIKPAYFNQDEAPYTYSVVIRNYNPADRGTVFDGEIPYSLRAALAHSDGRLYDATTDASALTAMTVNDMSITVTFGEETLILDGTHLSKDSNLYTLDTESIENMASENVDVIITTGGTGLGSRDITVETVESLFEKKIEGFGEIFRLKSFEEIGSAALLSRATAGIYKKTIIFSMPGSPNAVKTGLSLIIDELPHFVHHIK